MQQQHIQPELPPFWDNKLVDFGPPLKYPLICPAYTVEKVSVWQHINEEVFEAVVLQAPYMPKARAEGKLYCLSDEELFALDKERGAGLNCERKRMPVYVPYQNSKGQLTKLYVNIYVGVREYWAQCIGFNERTNTFGSPLDREFRLAPREPDSSNVLHNRFCIFPQQQRSPFVGAGNESIRRHVATRNTLTIRNLQMDKQRAAKERRRAWLKKFLSDD